jgi:coenzyme F420-0:L-glutamate ligase/coenzyme F420-1:gamma-L-glutamate ligase
LIDSHGAPGAGTVGVAIGLAGLPGVLDLRGRPDLYGYRLQTTDGDRRRAGGGASALMGQAAEATRWFTFAACAIAARVGSGIAAP